jgi:hypothetical protein
VSPNCVQKKKKKAELETSRSYYSVTNAKVQEGGGRAAGCGRVGRRGSRTVQYHACQKPSAEQLFAMQRITFSKRHVDDYDERDEEEIPKAARKAGWESDGASGMWILGDHVVWRGLLETGDRG